MTDPFNLQRFLDAQQPIFETALAELNAGSKQSHWMWFVFPQLRGLGRSTTAQFYGIASIDEARAFLEHPVLGSRLRACVGAILPWAGRHSAGQIFGTIDALKLRSSLTLFDQVERNSLFDRGLLAFCNGERDQETLALLNAQA